MSPVVKSDTYTSLQYKMDEQTSQKRNGEKTYDGSRSGGRRWLGLLCLDQTLSPLLMMSHHPFKSPLGGLRAGESKV